MKLEEVLKMFRGAEDLYQFTREKNREIFWYTEKEGRLFGVLEPEGIPVIHNIPLYDLMADDWIINYTDDRNARKVYLK